MTHFGAWLYTILPCKNLLIVSALLSICSTVKVISEGNLVILL